MPEPGSRLRDRIRHLSSKICRVLVRLNGASEVSIHVHFPCGWLVDKCGFLEKSDVMTNRSGPFHQKVKYMLSDTHGEAVAFRGLKTFVPKATSPLSSFFALPEFLNC
jgi:hypothetical protein